MLAQFEVRQWEIKIYCNVLALGRFEQESEQVSSKWLYWTYCNLCYIIIVVCWQSWTDRLLWLWTKAAMMLDWGSSTLDITTAGIVGISHCWYNFVYCTVLMLAVLTDGRWKLATAYCSTIRCHHCVMML